MKVQWKQAKRGKIDNKENCEVCGNTAVLCSAIVSASKSWVNIYELLPIPLRKKQRKTCWIGVVWGMREKDIFANGMGRVTKYPAASKIPETNEYKVKRNAKLLKSNKNSLW